jgi:hypothetical protein
VYRAGYRLLPAASGAAPDAAASDRAAARRSDGCVAVPEAVVAAQLRPAVVSRRRRNL